MKTSFYKASNEYLPVLDGLRAISILLVLVGHAGFKHVVPSGLGVIVFFVISGFLITRQLILEIETKGTLNIKQFYLRRIFRLAPALVFYIALFSVLLSLLGVQISTTHVLSGLFYFANYYHLYIGYPEGSPFPILWSLAVEEHFYIVFPFFIYLFRNNLKVMIFAIGALLPIVLCWRVALFFWCKNSLAFSCVYTATAINEGNWTFHRTDTIFDCILYGSFLALFLQFKPSASKRIICTPVFIASVAMLLFSLLFRNPFFRDTFRYSIQAFAIALLIVNVLYGTGIANRISHLLCTKPMVFIGKLSYSLYLFHYGVFVVLNYVMHIERPIHNSIALLVFIAATCILALFSYYCVERPMLALRLRLGSHLSTVTKCG